MLRLAGQSPAQSALRKGKGAQAGISREKHVWHRSRYVMFSASVVWSFAASCSWLSARREKVEIPPWPVGRRKGGDPTGNERFDECIAAACRLTDGRIVLFTVCRTEFFRRAGGPWTEFRLTLPTGVFRNGGAVVGWCRYTRLSQFTCHHFALAACLNFVRTRLRLC